jgi:NADH-quinone oxidoreductase subunit D
MYELAKGLEETTFFLNMGPQHPSTHGVLRIILRLDGEYVVEAEPVLGYIHRMQEKMAENRNYVQFLPNTGRLDYLSAMLYNHGYCGAVEKLMQLEVPPRAEYIRVITAELSRISSHLLWLGAYVMDLGGFTPFLYAFDDRENLLDLLENVCGSRLTYCYFRFGGVYNDVSPEFLKGTEKFIQRLRSRLPMFHDLVTGNVIFVHRTKDVGVISQECCRRYGATGPVARGSGLKYDVRKNEPYSIYNEFNFEVPVGPTGRGDALDRYLVRVAEIEQSLNIIEQALSRIPEGPVKGKVPKKLKPPVGDVYFAVETARGEFGTYIVSDGSDVPYRTKLRSPSYSNLSLLPEILPGTMVADTVSILGSVDVVIPEIDR